MKIEVGSFDDFIQEVKRAPKIYQHCVRLLVDRTALQDEEISFSVVVVLTALVIEEDETEYIVECVKHVGVDDPSGQHGTLAVDSLKETLDTLLPQPIAVRPGRIEA